MDHNIHVYGLSAIIPTVPASSQTTLSHKNGESAAASEYEVLLTHFTAVKLSQDCEFMHASTLSPFAYCPARAQKSAPRISRAHPSSSCRLRWMMNFVCPCLPTICSGVADIDQILALA